MRSSWQTVIDSLLRPARPHLERCLAEGEKHRAARRLVSEQRARALRDCELRIERARAAIFAANDGVVGASMTDLEREWRRRSRIDAESGWMDLWARIAPPSWIDEKRWRDTEGEHRLDAAIALASDVDGVEAAESAIDSLRVALAPWGTHIGPRVRFRLLEQDSEHCVALFAEPLRAALRLAHPVIVDRAHRFEREVHEAALHRFDDRPLLARDLAHAAFVDYFCRFAQPNPVSAMCALWRTGYVVATIDAAGVTLEIPML